MWWLSSLFKGLSFAQRGAGLFRLLLWRLVNIQHLAAQCWPRLRWGRKQFLNALTIWIPGTNLSRIWAAGIQIVTVLEMSTFISGNFGVSHGECPQQNLQRERQESFNSQQKQPDQMFLLPKDPLINRRILPTCNYGTSGSNPMTYFTPQDKLKKVLKCFYKFFYHKLGTALGIRITDTRNPYKCNG